MKIQHFCEQELCTQNTITTYCWLSSFNLKMVLNSSWSMLLCKLKWCSHIHKFKVRHLRKYGTLRHHSVQLFGEIYNLLTHSWICRDKYFSMAITQDTQKRHILTFNQYFSDTNQYKFNDLRKNIFWGIWVCPQQHSSSLVVSLFTTVPFHTHVAT